MRCLFCDIVSGKEPAYVIFEDKTHIAILDRYPIQLGHALVIPKEHYENIIDMPSDNISILFSKIPNIIRGILAATKAEGFNIGQNNGKAANQIIPHVHVHLIPRYLSTGNPWARRIIAKDEDLREMASRIKNLIKSY